MILLFCGKMVENARKSPHVESVLESTSLASDWLVVKQSSNLEQKSKPPYNMHL